MLQLTEPLRPTNMKGLGNKMKYTLIFLSAISLSSCWWKAGGDNPGIEYAPDMYYSKGYEPMSQFSDEDKYRYNPYAMSMREPVKGTVAIGQLDYQYPFENTPEGYEQASQLQINTDLTIEDQVHGEYMFGIYCSPCHGMEGKNDGPVVKKQATLKPAWSGYTDPYIQNLPIGKIYHVMTYGKNSMGSYAYALTPKERWSIAAYVKRMSMADSLGNVPAIKSISGTKNEIVMDVVPTSSDSTTNNNLDTVK